VSTEDQTVAAFAHLKDLPALQRSIVMLLIEKQGGMDQPGVNVVDIVTNIDASDAVEIEYVPDFILFYILSLMCIQQRPSSSDGLWVYI
jgi:hypothetical protein